MGSSTARQRMSHHKTVVVLVLFFMCAGRTLAGNAEKRVLYLLDSTGSMREVIDDERKVDMAKRVMGGLVREMDASAQLGLIVFGNSRRACEDLSVTVPFAAGSRVSLDQALRGLEPLGTTPLAGSVRAAGAYLKKTGRPAAIVLVTDGEEQCGDSPLDAARSLKAQGLDVVLHIIGLAVTDTVRKELEEMAHLGGGAFYNARTEAQLKDALHQASAEPNFLRLSASPKQAVYSKVLYSLRTDETLRLRFRPVQEVLGNGGPNLILFSVGPNEMELDAKGEGWAVNVHHAPPARLPQDLKILDNDWNDCRIVKRADGCEILINGVSVARLEDAEPASAVKVGVRGFDVDVSGISVDLQPF